MKPGRLPILICLIFTPVTHADWVLDNGSSRLSFVSTKAGTVAEVHHFATLAGSLSSNGQFQIDIDLASVQTGIAIRDERMREHFFEVDKYPQARVEAKLDLEPLRSLDVGEQAVMASEASVLIRGQQVPLTVEVSVIHSGPSSLLVVSRQPIVINASSLGLLAGLNTLRDLAGLADISPAVPVSFYLSFREEQSSDLALSLNALTPDEPALRRTDDG